MSPTATTAELVTFLLVSVSILALWIPFPAKHHSSLGSPWLALFSAAVGSGLVSGLLDWRSLLSLVGLACAAYWFYRRNTTKSLRLASALGVALFAVGLSLHVMPGFLNPRVISGVVLTAGAVPYTKYLNFDKAAVGVLLIAFAQRPLSTLGDLKALTQQVLKVALPLTAVLMSLSLLLGYVHFEPSRPPFFVFWAWTNLFFTCVAEEALFRGFLQEGLEKRFGKRGLPGAMSLFVAAALFGLAHYLGGPTYVLLSTVAGLGYGIAFRLAGRLEAAIATHFLVNATHFAFFTYPALASALA